MELSEFLLARIAEDEAEARAATERNGARWGTEDVQDGARITGDLRRESNPRAYGEDDALWDDEGALGMWQETASHIARWDPARVLAECEAKRRIVEQYAEYLSTVRAYRSPRWSDAMNEQDKENARQAEARHRVAEDMVRLLALPYADHPGYRQEWRT